MDLARATGISRNMLAKLYYDRARRVDLEDLAALCDYFGCPVGEMLEWVPGEQGGQAQGPRVKPKRLRRRGKK